MNVRALVALLALAVTPAALAQLPSAADLKAKADAAGAGAAAKADAASTQAAAATDAASAKASAAAGSAAMKTDAVVTKAVATKQAAAAKGAAAGGGTVEQVKGKAKNLGKKGVSKVAGKAPAAVQAKVQQQGDAAVVKGVDKAAEKITGTPTPPPAAPAVTK
ncbi:MAG: hypothetical protein IPO09_05660 [Anaeromyxobacter sp.]|nr:hypothetical protein [Anaeromyxobacter sp.]MBL0277158.1 hypothetical protein [Anaeromyxobacter sp.]